MAIDLASGQRVVLVQHARPLVVTKRGGARRRRHDVGEEHGRESTIRHMHGTDAGEELFDLVEDCVLVAEVRKVLIAG